MGDETKEQQYNRVLALRQSKGQVRLGLMINYAWDDDPKRLAFTFARYKFVAKMFAGYARVLEVGCADAFASRIVRQHVQSLSVTDFDPVFIEDARANQVEKWGLENIFVHDLLKGPPPGSYDGIYALDVLEHISSSDEDAFLENITTALTDSGGLIIGMPSVESQLYASPASSEGHINCKSQADLKATMLRHFENVFMFSMNDEVLHVGFAPMSQYLFALCVGKRSR